MPTFRKKAVEVEAVQFAGEMPELLPSWLRDAFDIGVVFENGDGLMIRTLEGALHVSAGDWIIQGTAGELYPCKPEIFAEIYEPVTIGRTELGAHA